MEMATSIGVSASSVSTLSPGSQHENEGQEAKTMATMTDTRTT